MLSFIWPVNIWRARGWQLHPSFCTLSLIKYFIRQVSNECFLHLAILFIKPILIVPSFPFRRPTDGSIYLHVAVLRWIRTLSLHSQQHCLIRFYLSKCITELLVVIVLGYFKHNIYCKKLYLIRYLGNPNVTISVCSMLYKSKTHSNIL